jgi:transposase
MLRIGATQRYVDPLAAGINDLQELSKTHEAISKAKTETWHRILTHYLPLYFPEIERFAGNSRSDWFLALLERFPTPSSIVALDRDIFVGEAWPVIGRKVSKARLLNDIYETARSSTALPVAEGSAAVTMFRMVLAEARSLIRQRDQIEKLAHARLADHADYRLLCTVPGIGPIHALTILAEAGDLRRFGHHRQIVGLDERGAVVQRLKFRREKLLAFFEQTEQALIGMEACPGSQWLARKLQAMGHRVRIIPAQFVRPYVKSNKNDTIDAEAIAEAVTRPTMRFTQVRSTEQVDLQALHRIRDQLVTSRTRLINQARAFCVEHGIAIRQGAGLFRRDLPLILDDETNDLTQPCVGCCGRSSTM